ncbi:DUF262 domain-containing protein [Qipengyuania sp. DSG2-2]|uniref:DUF262 domain-containing protein n=1 Tax=Qipengyuania sp. DGS2-2 TaxID=3349631 RepID=UPI0036D321B7
MDSNIEQMNLFNDDGDEEPLPVQIPVLPEGASDQDIEDFFRKGRLSVQKEENKIFLTYVVDFIRTKQWGELRPEYQRRLRWDNKKKSRLIESFLMNVPVPPIFLYEKNIGEFEVMDGQQRLNAIIEFFDGNLELEGLEVWRALNGRTFAGLPPLVRKGLQRATMSTITLTPEDDETNPYAHALRSQVFDRLNTGGEKLNAQELRNALYGGPFNEQLIRLSGLPKFTDAWKIPRHEAHTLSDGAADQVLRNHSLYKRMLDVEIVLRFFAFQDPKKISGSVRRMLDNMAETGSKLSIAAANQKAEEFETTLNLAHTVFGDQLFRLAPKKEGGATSPSRPLYDAVMVALFQMLHEKETIEHAADEIRERVVAFTYKDHQEYDTLVGRANTASSIQDRIKLIKKEIEAAL